MSKFATLAAPLCVAASAGIGTPALAPSSRRLATKRQKVRSHRRQLVAIAKPSGPRKSWRRRSLEFTAMESFARQALQAALEIADVEPGGSAFSQSDDHDALWVDARQIVHEKSPSVLEVRLTKAAMRAQRAGVMADPRLSHARKASEWVTVTLGGLDDLSFIHQVIALAAAIHRPVAGAVLRGPPVGADLARRRRFD